MMMMDSDDKSDSDDFDTGELILSEKMLFIIGGEKYYDDNRTGAISDSDDFDNFQVSWFCPRSLCSQFQLKHTILTWTSIWRAFWR